MDIHSAKAASSKVLKFINDVNQSKKSFYNNNRKNLSAISANCETISAMIDNILCNVEAVSHPITDLSDSLNMAYRLSTFISSIKNSDTKLYQSSLDRLKQLNKVLLETVSDISNILYDESECEDCDCILPSDSEIEKPEEVKCDSRETLQAEVLPKSLTKQDRKSAIQNYCDVINNLGELPYQGYMNLRDLLKRWFTVRFRQHDDQFKYNIKNLPTWMMYFVAVYGQSLEAGTCTQLTSEISRWIDEVELNGGKYALPYQIFSSIHKDGKEVCTTCGNLLWNMLFECGMNRFDNLQPPELYPNSDTFYYWSSDVNLSALDDYVPYDPANQELYEKYNIV